MTVAEFRAAMTPLFDSVTEWPDPTVQAALTASATYLSVTEWGTFYVEGVTNWVADRLVANKILATVGAVGAASGTETMKQVGRVLVQRDAQVILANMNNPYGWTRFGQRYTYLVELVFGGSTLAAPVC
jgi:hypothetical protein